MLVAKDETLATTTRMLPTRRLIEYAEEGYDCDGNCLNDADATAL